jgi:hypothetical protein
VEGTVINPEDFTDKNVAHEVEAEEDNSIVSDLTVNEDGELIVKEEEETPAAETDVTEPDSTETDAEETGSEENENGQKPE